MAICVDVFFKSKKSPNIGLCNTQSIRQGVSWCDDLDSKVLTKFCKPNAHSKYL